MELDVLYTSYGMFSSNIVILVWLKHVSPCAE